MLRVLVLSSAAFAGVCAFGARSVDPFIGTLANGHCNPGAARPFAFVQPGPDTGNGSWDYCGGYRYDDTTIDGFSQTHASGTGRAEMGDVLLLPFCGQEVRRRLPFTHEGEVAIPGYYAVTLDGGRIRAEMTSTQRTAIHRYAFREAPARLLVDLQHGITSQRRLVSTHVLSNRCAFAEDGVTLLGTSFVRKDWPEHAFSFAIRFDRPYRAKTRLPAAEGEKGPRFVLDFDLKPGESLGVKVALSMKSPERALANLEAEIPDWDFERVRRGSAAEWERILSRVEVEGAESDRRRFDTALYHLCLQPNDISDVGESPRYSTMSIWDTFRAAHPLYTLVVPERVDGFVETLLAHAEEFGYLPQWLMWGKDGHVMIGNHAVPILLDALRKGFRVDVPRAYAAIRETLLVEHEDNPKDDWAVYDRHGYYPLDVIRGEGVSRTMECAFDDWCAAEFARRLGRADEARRFERRAGFWRNVLDPYIGFARGRRADGRWREPFDPLWYQPPEELGGSWWVKDFTEGNAWQYTFHVLHDVEGLVEAFGGKDRLLARLDGLFSGETTEAGEQDRDASGRIGQYAHGNEPCHHIPYLYALLGRPERTQALVRRICDELYGAGRDGLCGNDDCGQMSAWFAFSALGFYPYNPAAAEYVLGAPQVARARLSLPNGRTLRIVAKGLSRANRYVARVTFDGRPWERPTIGHAELLRGGELVFEMTDRVDATPKWPEITRESRPWAYNWWMASAVDREGLEAQCAAMEEAGLGGFHVIPIYGAKGYEAKYLKYLSPEWMKAFGDAVEIGARHGLGVDMTMGSGWCFGGPQLKPEQGCWKLEKTPDGRPPHVTWKLTGQKVKRAGPGGAGPMMDPFSVEAIEAFLAPYAVFDAPGAAKPLRVYHDSWEYFHAGWSPGLFDAFRRRRGYDLREHLRELAGIGDAAEVARVRLDYRETLSDVVIEDVFPKWTAWAQRRGIGTRNEAHGTCANWLDFYAIADIPETEMFAEECRDILVSKFASSAAHVAGKRYVSSESCTWLKEHFTETLADFKAFIDRLLLAGVNHMYYHGCCYSPTDAVWPGWCFYASSEMNPRNPIWRDARPLNDYIARCQSMFQSCSPDNDVLVYWPLRDYWAQADGFAQRMTVHDAADWFHAQPIGAEARRLYAEGYAFDYVSDRQLQRLDLSRYARIVVPPCRYMPPATRKAIDAFRSRPARVEPFARAGLSYSRYRRGEEVVYFVVNTNDAAYAGTLQPTARGAAWLMDPMDGGIVRAPMTEAGVALALEAKQSKFLIVRPDEPAFAGVPSPPGEPIVADIAGPWTLEAVCGGPELPKARTMTRLATWSRNEDGGENPFSGTMRYATAFEWGGSREGEATLDLGEVRQSARVRVNGVDVGFAFMPPHRVRFPASVLKPGRNRLEVEVTSTGANRIRWNDRNGVRWKYFTDANMVAYGYTGPLDASKWPLADCGLLGPVRLAGTR